MVGTTLSPRRKMAIDIPPSQSSEARLYTFSPETKTALRKFRLGTSRAKDPQAVICMSLVGFQSPINLRIPYPQSCRINQYIKPKRRSELDQQTNS